MNTVPCLGWRPLLAGLMLGMLGMLGAVAAAEPVTWVCPGRVEGVAGASVADAPAGWALQANAEPQRLTAVTVFDGPPEEGVVLKPRWTAPDGRRMVWSLTRLATPPAWVSCEYSGGSLRLVRAVPEGLRWCEATVTRQPRPAALEISLHCAETERPTH